MSTSSGAGGSGMPRLGPAWRSTGTSGVRGFQPPPAVPDERKQARDRSGSHASGASGVSGASSSGGGGGRNPFSLLDEDEDGNANGISSNGGDGRPRSAPGKERGGPTPPGHDRFSSLRGSGDGPAPSSTSSSSSRPYARSSTAGARPSGGGRSLADLAAGLGPAPPPGGGREGHRRASAGAAPAPGSGAPRGGFVSDGTFRMEPAGDAVKVTRYTRERLLSLRRGDGTGVPEQMKGLEGSSVLSEAAQDPVCWDTFEPDEIWAQAARERRAGTVAGAPRGARDSGGEDEAPRRESGRGGGGGREPSGFGSSRWQRGMSIPDSERGERGRPGSSGGSRPPAAGGNNGEEASRPEDLWDDPSGPTGAASDFSAFGGSLEAEPRGSGKTGMESFALSDMSRAAAAFESELHGDRGETPGPTDGGDEEEEDDDDRYRRVDSSAPLAGSGGAMSIRSGSGDHVSVFEDFGDEAPAPAAAEEEEEPAVRSAAAAGGGGKNASSLLMKMIGVAGTGEAAAAGDGVPDPPAEPALVEEPKAEEPKAAEDAAPAAAVSSNPWGAPAPSAAGVSSNPWGDSAGLDSFKSSAGDDAAQLRRDEDARRRLAEEEEKRKWAAASAERERRDEEARRQREQAAAQQKQVELVLLERISNILEGSWGRSDLPSVLSTLHANDSRVIAILSTVEALRALISRHPERVQLGRDPTMGAEMAALRMTNAQWRAHEQAEAQRKRQAEAQAAQQQLRAQQEQQLRAAREQQQQQEALARAQQQQQPGAGLPPVTDAPWYYADPQGNIQGPFGGGEMRQWLEAGYFKGDLPISQNPGGPFRALSAYFPGTGTAFQVREDPAAAAAARARREAEERAAAERQRQARLEQERQAQAQQQAQARALAEQEAANLRAQATEQRRLQEAHEAKARLEEESRRALEEAQRQQRAEAEAEKARRAAEEANAEQSNQLKMMLGLGGAGVGAGAGQDGIVAGPPEPAAKSQTQAAAKSQPKKREKKKPSASSAQAPQSSEPRASKPAAPPAPAWGGAAAPSSSRREKSMSEIQAEEAREAARRARENPGTGGGSGWAGVASAGGTTAWGGAASAAPPVPAAAPAPSRAAPRAPPSQPASAGRRSAPKKSGGGGGGGSRPAAAPSGPGNVDNFGAGGRLTPSLESWCREQMTALNGSDDLTLVSFCMTLTDRDEIRQYLTAYLGNTPGVNSFATEFIRRTKGGGPGSEWESAGGSKKGRKKRGGK